MRQHALRAAFSRAIGSIPSPPGPPPVRVTGTIERPGYRIEKLIYEARPGVWVTANCYLPKPDPLRTAAVLILSGHFEAAKALPEYQVLCQLLAQEGLVALIFDPVGQGERLAYVDPSTGASRIGWGCPEHEYANWQVWSVGGSPTRYFVHDAVRAIDLLAARPEVDAARIAVTGSSGGGSLTCALMICEPRVCAAAPATFLSGLREYAQAGGALDSEETWPASDGMVFDHEDALFAFAPRPVMVLAAKSDFFPIEGTRRTVARAHRVWELYGKGRDLEIFEDDAFHSFTLPLARAAAGFFSRHLLCREATVAGLRVSPLKLDQLRCTTSGQVSMDMPGCRFIIDENRHQLANLAAFRDNATRFGSAHDSSARDALAKGEALTWLHGLVFEGRRPPDTGIRLYSHRKEGGLEVQGALWWAQEGLFGHGVLYRDAQYDGKTLSVSIGIWDGGTAMSARHGTWVRTVCHAGRAALVLDVAGSGALQPPDHSGRDPLGDDAIMYRLAHTLFRLGDSLVALRVFDVTRALDALEQWPHITIEGARLHGTGRHGVYAELAAFVDARVQEVRVDGSMGSWALWAGSRRYRHRDVMSVTLPAVLEHFDLPDIERWLGPRFFSVESPRPRAGSGRRP